MQPNTNEVNEDVVSKWDAGDGICQRRIAASFHADCPNARHVCLQEVHVTQLTVLVFRPANVQQQLDENDKNNNDWMAYNNDSTGNNSTEQVLF